MRITLKSLFLVAALLALGTGMMAVSPASSAMASNGLTINGLSSNGIHMNGLTVNGTQKNAARTSDTAAAADPNRLHLRAIRLPGE